MKFLGLMQFNNYKYFKTDMFFVKNYEREEQRKE